MLARVGEELEESCRVKQQFSEELKSAIARLAEEMAATLRAAGTIFWMGNGGSAADAQHLAAELTVRLQAERPGLAALALTTNTSVLTAAGNDYGFERIFARQVDSLVAAEDVVVALSTSGMSPNILHGAEAAHARGAYVVALTGETGGKLASLADLLINVPSRDAQRIQEAHITIGHIVCGLIEKMCAARGGS